MCAWRLAQQFLSATATPEQMLQVVSQMCGAQNAISHNHAYWQFQPLIDDFETYLNETVFSTNFMDTFTPLGLGVF